MLNDGGGGDDDDDDDGDDDNIYVRHMYSLVCFMVSRL